MGFIETAIQRDVIDYLSSRGFLVWRNQLQGIMMNGRRLRNPNKGQPDVWAVKRGRLLGVEVKTEKGVLSVEQTEFIARAERFGVTVIVARSIQDLIDALALMKDFT